jgi:hypothetical protein
VQNSYANRKSALEARFYAELDPRLRKDRRNCSCNGPCAHAFYRNVLGLDQKPLALVFDANGTMLRVTAVGEHHPVPFAVLGWDVEAIQTTVDQLTLAGVVLSALSRPERCRSEPHLDRTRRRPYRMVSRSR